MSGLKTFLNIIDSLEEEIQKETKLLVAGEIKCIGNENSEKIFHRLDGIWYHNFRSQIPFFNLTSRNSAKLSNLLLNRKIIKNIKKSNNFIFQSEYSLRQVKKFMPNLWEKYISKRKYKIINNGSDFGRENFTKKNLVSNNHISLISVSVDYPCKRLNYIYKLADLLQKQNINFSWTLCIANPGYIHKVFNEKLDHFGLIKKFNNENKNSYFKLNINASRRLILEELKNSDLFVTFSHVDPCPNAVIEAKSLGIPCIGPSSGGVKELIENELLFHTNIEDCKPFDWNKIIKVDDEEIYYASKLINDIIKNYNDYLMKSQLKKFFWSDLRMIKEYKDFLSS